MRIFSAWFVQHPPIQLEQRRNRGATFWLIATVKGGRGPWRASVAYLICNMKHFSHFFSTFKLCVGTYLIINKTTTTTTSKGCCRQLVKLLGYRFRRLPSLTRSNYSKVNLSLLDFIMSSSTCGRYAIRTLLKNK